MFRSRWHRWLAAAALAAGSAWLVGPGRDLPVLPAVLLWGLLAAGGLAVLGGGRVGLFGPVLGREMVRTARRGHFIWPRVVYLLLLLFTLWLAADEAARRGRSAGRLGEEFFVSFLWLQLWAVVVLTPAVVAGAIAEEKERGRLDFLLTADLHDHEIVLSKLAGRLAHPAMVVLAGLPVLSLLQLLGGIHPELLLFAFAVTALTMLGVGGVSILCSTLFRTVRAATIAAYVWVLLYLLLTVAAQHLVQQLFTWRGGDSRGGDWTEVDLTAFDLADEFGTANPFLLPRRLEDAASQGQLAQGLPAVLGRYALCHGLLAAACVGWASLRLRSRAAREAGEGTRAPPAARPPVADRPMIWKEVYVDGGRRWRRPARAAFGLLVLASLAPAPIIILLDLPVSAGGEPRHGRELALNVWVRVVGTAVGTLGLLAVAVRAAGSVTGEREKGTLDGLAAAPLRADAILFAKWLGSIRGAWWVWPWLGMIWAVALLGGGLHVTAVGLLAGAWLGYAAAFAALGLCCSAALGTTVRATVATLLGTLFLPCLGWPQPIVLVGLTFQGMEFADMHRYDGTSEAASLLVIAVMSWTIWVICGLWFWSKAHELFRALINRREPGDRA